MGTDYHFIVALPLFFGQMEYYSLLFLNLITPARPTRPVPKSNMVTGSGLDEEAANADHV